MSWRAASASAELMASRISVCSAKTRVRPSVVLRNDSGGHWLTLVVRGRGKQWRAVGATAVVAVGGRKQTAVVQGTRGYLSASDDRLHFGLGTATKVDRIVVRWPDGTQKELRDVAADQFLEITP